MQEGWVLMSGSADQSEISSSSKLHPIHDDKKLISKRHQNAYKNDALVQDCDFPVYKGKNYRPAIIITGHLRCLERSRHLIKKLSESCDIYVVTNKQYKREALSIARRNKILIIEENQDAIEMEKKLLFNPIKQWQKLAIGLRLIEEREIKKRRKYTHILKIRTDYFFAHPKNMLEDLRVLSNSTRGLVGTSDKVFGGKRDQMMLMKGFFDGILGWQIRVDDMYWPINIEQILESDESMKWYGFNWPIELIGTPNTVDELRDLLTVNYSILKQRLQQFRPNKHTSYHNLFKGNTDFASEVAFARHLNFVGLPFNECYGLRGFLYQDRK